VNGGYLTYAMIAGSAAEVPVAGEVVAGADAVGHAAVGAAKGVWHGITSIF
jgi:hypothetical protein